MITEAMDRIIAVENIILNDVEEGIFTFIPLIYISVWLVCKYIAANVGPIEQPRNLKRLLIPIITPEYSCGAEVEDDTTNSGVNTSPRIPTKGDGLSTLYGDKVLSPP